MGLCSQEQREQGCGQPVGTRRQAPAGPRGLPALPSLPRVTRKRPPPVPPVPHSVAPTARAAEDCAAPLSGDAGGTGAGTATSGTLGSCPVRRVPPPNGNTLTRALGERLSTRMLRTVPNQEQPDVPEPGMGCASRDVPGHWPSHTQDHGPGPAVGHATCGRRR